MLRPDITSPRLNSSGGYTPVQFTRTGSHQKQPTYSSNAAIPIAFDGRRKDGKTSKPNQAAGNSSKKLNVVV